MDKLKNWIQENSHKMDVEEPKAATWDLIKRSLSKPIESDPLKNIIAENKNELEIEIPDAESWEKISRSVVAKKPAPAQRIKRILIYVSAACIITIISLGVFRYFNDAQTNSDKDVTKKTMVKNNDTTNTVSDKTQLTATSSLPEEALEQNIKHKNIPVASSKPEKKQPRKSLPPEVVQIQKDYDQLITGQIAYTRSLAVYGENANYFQEFKNDFKALENQEKELRKSIAEHGLQDNSIDDLAMIYQQKLIVLKKLQNEINKTSNRNKNLTDTIPTYISL